MQRKIAMLLCTIMIIVCVAGCGGPAANTNETSSVSETTAANQVQEETTSEKVDVKAPVIPGLTYESTVELEYAKCFQIFRYEGGYSVIRVDDGRDYILIPEGGATPEGLPSSCVILQKPLDKIYLQATSVMCFFDEIDALDHIRLAGTNKDGWYVDNAVTAMENGEIIFAGKYSEPDYELMMAEGCDLALESTMILHNPEVMEKLEEMGIPVFVERSSYETEPLAKTEWVKLIGEMVEEPEKAQQLFDEQKQLVSELENFENTEKTIAFFYVNQNGLVVTRKSEDYFAKMIEDAGGRYVFENLGDPESKTSGVNMTMEEFYATAKDADYIIYNASIDEPLNSVDELIAQNVLFADFRAVQNGNVWTTGKSLHQATDDLGSMTKDIHTMLVDENAEELTFMKRLH